MLLYDPQLANQPRFFLNPHGEVALFPEKFHCIESFFRSLFLPECDVVFRVLSIHYHYVKSLLFHLGLWPKGPGIRVQGNGFFGLSMSIYVCLSLSMSIYVYPVCSVYPVYSVYPVCLVYLVYLVRLVYGMKCQAKGLGPQARSYH